MAIARLTHLRLSIPLSGAPPGKVPESCFPDAETAVTQPPPRRVSSQISPPLTQPVVEVTDEDAPASEGDGLQTCSPESEMPPPPGFPPFVFPDDDGGIDVDEISARLGECATDTSQEMDPGLPDIPEESEVPEVVVPRPPSPNTLSPKQCRRWVMIVCLYRRQTMMRYQNWYGCLLSLRQRDGVLTERGWCLGGG